jgi:serine/threonine protein kinase/WD40 repeat protein
MARLETEAADQDERLGEAVEQYLALAESGTAPDPEAFAASYPDLGAELRDALEGLSLVRGLIGSSSGRGMGQRLVSGCRLAGYRIVGELGSGGMGVVYEAVHIDLDRPVALKVLDARATRDGTGLRRFLNEARTAASLHHTHIVPVFDVGHVGGLCYYAMQRIQGSGLDRVVKALRQDRTVGAGSGTSRRGRRSPGPLVDTMVDRSGLTGGSTTTWAGQVPRSPSRGPSPLGRETADAPAPFLAPRGSAYYRWVAEVGRQAAQALAHAHRRGIVHRDIKPSNLLIEERGLIWVADFGLARQLSDPGLTNPESLIGTPRYMSPEQSRSLPLDGRTDIYSLGATLYELLTLRPPFEGRSTAELIEQINRDDPVPPRRLDNRIPRDLETIVLKSLSRRPGDRYVDAESLAADLERFLNYEPVRARRIGPLGRTWRYARRHPALSSVTVGSTAIILAVASVAYLRVVQERDRAVQAEQTAQGALREGLLSQAALVRVSTVPDRRDRGLDLIGRAAALNPDADLRARLRAEAASFLSLRDLEKRPLVASGRGSGLAFGPEGSRLVTLSEDRSTLTFWSGETEKASERTMPAGPPSSLPSSAVVEPGGPGRPGPGRGGPGRGGPGAGGWSGARVAVAGPLLAVIWPDGHGIRLIDMGTGLVSADLPIPDREVLALQAAATPDGPRLVTLDREREDGREDRRREPLDNLPRRVSLWDASHPEAPLAVLEPPTPTFEGRDGELGLLLNLPLFTIAPNGETIALCWFRGPQVALFSGKDGRPRATIDTGTALSALSLDAYGHLATAGGGAVRLWDLAEPQAPVSSFTPHQSYVRNLRFSPDGTLVAITGFGSDIELWDPSANLLVAALPTPDPVSEIAFSASGQALAAGQPSGVAIWAVVDPKVVSRTAGLEAPASSLSFDGTGQLALAFRGSEPARLWHPADSPTSAQATLTLKPSALTFDGSGRLAVLDGDALAWWSGQPLAAEKRLELPPLAQTVGPDRARGPLVNLLRSILGLSRSLDGRTLAVLRYNQVLIWRASEPDRLALIEPPSEPDPGRGRGRPEGRRGPAAPWLLSAVHPSGDRLYLAGPPGPPPSPPSSSNSDAPGRPPGGNAGGPGDLQAWALRGDRATTMWRAPGLRPSALALSPDGQTLAVGDRGATVLLLDAATGKEKSRIAPGAEPDGPATALAFAPDGMTLAVGTRTGSILIHHLTPTTLGAEGPPLRLPPHRGAALVLAFDPTGRQLATAGEDKVVAVWDLGQLSRELQRLGLTW